ncbi:hypothetical protein [Tepidibacter hydrothermalis]|uniref:Uncharacterized protein n=1 Tax=Tepidibacter hydrothermalis TaxID=3036126 RepID=A0ABY8EIM8_9FIRM|nr:hypothetical protein [Tepidibacter hydrothermalis]WFD10785.1 hypothetical protein P4S50_01530 [Tepidibacter hydrothermalis]
MNSQLKLLTKQQEASEKQAYLIVQLNEENKKYLENIGKVCSYAKKMKDINSKLLSSITEADFPDIKRQME